MKMRKSTQTPCVCYIIYRGTKEDECVEPDFKYQGFKIRIYPNKDQEQKLHLMFNAKIKAYNWGLARQLAILPTDAKLLNRRVLKTEFVEEIKVNPEYEWIKNLAPSPHMLYFAFDDLNNTIKKWLTKKAGKPRFKSVADVRKSISQRNDMKLIIGDKVQVAKIGTIPANKEQLRRVPEITDKKSVTSIRFSYDGLNYYLSFNMLIPVHGVKPTTEPIGIDLGITKLMTCSDGTTIGRPDNLVYKVEKKINRLRRQAGRLYETGERSNNLKKLEKEIRKLEQKKTNILNNNIYTSIKQLVDKNPEAIVMEDLNVSGMLRNRHVSRQLQRAKFRFIRDQMNYKCDRNSIKFILADRWYPSSQICSSCGNRQKIGKGQRVYHCKSCGDKIDRDFNASLNLKGLAK